MSGRGDICKPHGSTEGVETHCRVWVTPPLGEGKGCGAQERMRNRSAKDSVQHRQCINKLSAGSGSGRD